MKHILLAAALAGGALLPQTATAQGRSCGERGAIIERLQSHYGEERTGAGLASTNGVVEIFASSETGSWTIILTLPTGQSCLVAAGEGWVTGPFEAAKSGRPA